MIEKLFEDIKKLSETAVDALNEADKRIKSETTEAEYDRYRKFLSKYTSLMQQGKIKKAQELATEYGNQSKGNG